MLSHFFGANVEYIFKFFTQVKDYDLMVEEEEQIAFVLAENVPGTIMEKVSTNNEINEYLY
jgi:hypothetical protein